MSKRYFNVFFDHFVEMTEIERELDNMEASWADFAYAINPMSEGRIQRRYGAEGPCSERGQSLPAVHGHLEVRRKDFEAGDRSALFYALLFCAAENVPLPYWIGNELLTIEKRLHADPEPGAAPCDLHDEFGFSKTLPTTGTRAVSNRRKANWAVKIWGCARRIMADRGITSVDAAVRLALKELDAPYAVRKATEMFNEVERRQKRLTRPFR